jgi:restriction endonuclease S subunit
MHTCSYYCEKPECVLAQRDELRQKLEQAEKQWVGLTDEEKEEIGKEKNRWDEIFEAIEAKLKEKNCPSAD